MTKMNQMKVSKFPKPEFVTHLASGSMGSVDLVQFEQKLWALKTISKIEESYRPNYLEKEIEAGQMVNHPNIVGLEREWEDDENVYLLMEYVEGQDLLEFIETEGDVSEDDGRIIFQQLVDAVASLHSQGIAHRDLKLDNIMINLKLQTKIIDFGLSEISNAHRCLDKVGTDEYCAPEVSNNKPYNGFRADIWSLGVVLYAVLFGTFPFSSSSLKRIRMGWAVPIPFDIPDVSFEAKALIQRMLNVDPKKRPTIEEIANDEWLQEMQHRPLASSASQ
eukprot:TRINITY_DN2600_c0_g1_i1.p1 TRINITY_DN2600_c0_g1~~TRINITY_DN2600_c0_g1_i1.p1  ORF type:complete len:277 (+),score=77.72 TRINITY_DN2600_c0_g1_i1:102-932(+)